MTYQFRQAELSDSNQIWEILKQAIQRRKEDGSNQWQDGYPNPDIIQKDIDQNQGFVLTESEDVIGYCAILINDEPDYERIEGEWLSQEDFVVFHRMAIAKEQAGKGLGKLMMHHIEQFALDNDILSVKADTNHDNPAMKNNFEKSGYTFCGQVYINGSPRKAFEKLLAK
jgi:GNAT superfamily N-acetyltransferase